MSKPSSLSGDHCSAAAFNLRKVLHRAPDDPGTGSDRLKLAIAPRHAAHGDSAGTNMLWQESLALVEQHLRFGRRKVGAGERIYECGETFDTLYLVSTGLCKTVNLSADGREQPAGLHFTGDWLGFDGIATGRHDCSGAALDGGEVWTVRYETLLLTGARLPQLMRVLLAAMSTQMARHRAATLAMSTLPADARVADFLLRWTQALAERGLRTDQISIHMTRADIGNYVGLTLESVSRALSRLARCGVIRFDEKGRRDICIPALGALHDFIRTSTEPAEAVLQ